MRTLIFCLVAGTTLWAEHHPEDLAAQKWLDDVSRQIRSKPENSWSRSVCRGMKIVGSATLTTRVTDAGIRADISFQSLEEVRPGRADLRLHSRALLTRGLAPLEARGSDGVVTSTEDRWTHKNGGRLTEGPLLEPGTTWAPLVPFLVLIHAPPADVTLRIHPVGADEPVRFRSPAGALLYLGPEYEQSRTCLPGEIQFEPGLRLVALGGPCEIREPVSALAAALEALRIENEPEIAASFKVDARLLEKLRSEPSIPSVPPGRLAEALDARVTVKAGNDTCEITGLDMPLFRLQREGGRWRVTAVEDNK